MTSRPCVFLDRDGVINEPAAIGDYIRDWGQFKLLPNIVDWIRIFNTLGYLVIVVTNQRGVTLGFMDAAAVEDIHTKMKETLAASGARIDDVFYCPHEYGTCNCRKPLPGMIEQAALKWNIDLQRSLLIGDMEQDEELARVCGLRFLRASGDGCLAPVDQPA